MSSPEKVKERMLGKSMWVEVDAKIQTRLS